MRDPYGDEAHVIVFGRLSLFGAGATRLHDELLPVAAVWHESAGEGHREPVSPKEQTQLLDRVERLLRESTAVDKAMPASVVKMLLGRAADDFATLWPHVRDDADSRAHEAERMLHARAETEAEDLRQILASQRGAIERELQGRLQLRLDFGEAEKEQRAQYDFDRRHMEKRLGEIDRELETEPAQIRSLYRVALRRLQPIGLLYLCPID